MKKTCLVWVFIITPFLLMSCLKQSDNKLYEINGEIENLEIACAQEIDVELCNGPEAKVEIIKTNKDTIFCDYKKNKLTILATLTSRNNKVIVTSPNYKHLFLIGHMSVVTKDQIVGDSISIFICTPKNKTQLNIQANYLKYEENSSFHRSEISGNIHSVDLCTHAFFNRISTRHLIRDSIKIKDTGWNNKIID